MWIAVLVALFSYFGLESIAVASGEAVDPQRAITSAFRATIVRLVLFYLLTLPLVLAMVPWTLTASGATQSPFVTVMTRTHIAGAAGVIEFVILVAALPQQPDLPMHPDALFALAGRPRTERARRAAVPTLPPVQNRCLNRKECERGS